MSDEIKQYELEMAVDLATRWGITPSEAGGQLVEWGILD